jgi:hypothetical protein
MIVVLIAGTMSVAGWFFGRGHRRGSRILPNVLLGIASFLLASETVNTVMDLILGDTIPDEETENIIALVLLVLFTVGIYIIIKALLLPTKRTMKTPLDTDLPV